MKKLSDTFCRCALATGAISQCEPLDPPMTFCGVAFTIFLSAICWAALAWLFTAVWLLA